MANRTRPDDRPAYERPPARLFAIASALVAAQVIPWWLLLGASERGALLFAVCVVFTAIAFGLAALCVVQALRTRHGRRDSAAVPDAAITGDELLKTGSGRLPMWAASVQILLVPAALALGFTLLALVALFVAG